MPIDPAALRADETRRKAAGWITAALALSAIAGLPTSAIAQPGRAAGSAGVRATSKQTSDNWAGYAVTAPKPFRRVVGSWVQPSVSCEGVARGYAAFWVGIGGFTSAARALEQIGTQANCEGDRTSTYAWYELLPAGQVTLKLSVHPGDHIPASVTVSGKRVALHLHDLSTGKSFAGTVRMSKPDTSSAEWIAEAPSACTNNGRVCETLPLADFGSVGFIGASAQTRGRAVLPAGSASFNATELLLQGAGTGLGSFGRALASSAAGQAQPGALTDSGSGFTVTWEQAPTPQAPSPPAAPALGEAGASQAPRRAFLRSSYGALSRVL